MSSKLMLGLFMSAAVTLGATAASADQNVVSTYHDKKVAVIKDNKGKNDDFCKVPIKVKGENVTLASDDAKVQVKEITRYYKKYILAKCDFKDKVDFYYYKDIHKKGFKCEFDNKDYELETRNSVVHVDFDRKWGKKGHYKSRPKHVVAKVHLECLFEKPKDDYQPPKKHYPPKTPPQKNDDHKY
ncbi:hypothetical protein [Geminicoccus harenae]|uniref:hypothetical protein n=1 Tax=Geminicoccus harenae TaxID=2498453 RepID=UPI00168C07B9|nr:hypothetical protein [Geminicoccus harenae]